MIIVQASNIHVGGGAVLLNQLIDSFVFTGQNVTVFVDARFKCKTELPSSITIKKVQPGIKARLGVEWLLRSYAKNANTKVLFFGNLPPLFKLKCECYLFFQNVIMLNRYRHFKFPILTRIKQFVERIWLSFGIRHIKTIYVQSESVKNLFQEQFPNTYVEVRAFSDSPILKNSLTLDLETQKYDFIYVASGDAHKNHFNLLKAWLHLAQNGLKLSLILTIDGYKTIKELEVLKEVLRLGGQITFMPNLDHQQILKLYAESKVLIFPSLAESFGLPLIEASSMGLPVIASESDFVRDLVNPVQTFDPQSYLSIARAVERHLQHSQSNQTEIISPQKFIETFLK